MLKKFALGLALVAFSFGLRAQPMQKGQRSLAINVNPIFGYVGNLFTDNEYYNTLSFNGAGLIYRKVYKENRALRFSLNIDGRTGTENYLINSQLWQETRREIDFYGSISIGQEFFKISPTQKKGSWRKYGGYDVRLFGGYNELRYNYETLPNSFGPYYPYQSEGFRPVQRVYNQRVGTGFAGFLGIEYYFSDHFFIGVEAYASMFVAYQFNDKNTTHQYFFDDNLEQYITLPSKTVSGGEGLELGLDSGFPVIFRAGFTF